MSSQARQPRRAPILIYLEVENTHKARAARRKTTLVENEMQPAQLDNTPRPSCFWAALPRV